MKYDKITRPFNMENGMFSLINMDYLMCLMSIPPGVRGKIAVSIFYHIINSTCRENSQDNDKKGSLWSSPLNIELIINLLEGDREDLKNKTSTRNNYANYINDLLKNKVFYRFGRNNSYCYFYEKNILSWGYMWDKKKSYVYPITIKKIINSYNDLWDFNWHLNQENNQNMTIEDFNIMFAYFISDLVRETPETLRKNLIVFDKKKMNANVYVNKIYSIISEKDNLFEIDTIEGFKIERMPMVIRNKFEELIPEEVKNNAGGYKSKVKNNKSLYYLRERILSNYNSIKDISESKLDVKDNPYHLMSYMERRMKEFFNLNEDIVIYNNMNFEVQACNSIHDLLKKEISLTDVFIKEWIRWFLRNTSNSLFSKNKVICGQLLRTYYDYKKVCDSNSESGLFSSIFDNMSSKYVNNVITYDLCKQFGFFLTYSFMLVKVGEKMTNDEFLSMLKSIDEKDTDEKVGMMFPIAQATFFKDNEKGLINKDCDVYKMFCKMLKENDLIPEGGVKWQKQDIEHNSFWRKIEHEYRRKN